MFLRLIANKYHKGKVKKDFDKINKQCLNLLKRKRGVLLKLWKIAACAFVLPAVPTQVWLRCLGEVCVALLPLSISVSSLFKGNSKYLVLCRVADECTCPHLSMFSLVTTWCHSPRLETRIKESNMRVSS